MMRSRLLLGVLAVCLRATAAGQAITEFPLLTPLTYPGGITAGPDGNVWFTQVTQVPYACPHPFLSPGVCYYPEASAISRISSSGVITEFPIPKGVNDLLYQPDAITTGPDGSLWFTEFPWAQIGRMPIGGSITHFSVSTGGGFGGYGIVTGSDGNLWFPSWEGWIGRVTPSGVISQFPEPSANCGDQNSQNGCGFDHIAAGPDGNLWFTEYVGDKLGRITPTGEITEFGLPTGSSPFGIAAGPDASLWFTEAYGNKIGRITPAGSITEYAIPTARAYPGGIAPGPDGNLWFTEANQIGRITPAGVITEFPVPTANSGPTNIAAGPDGNIWFTESVGKIGRLALSAVGTCEADLRTLCLNASRFAVTAAFQTTPEGPSTPATAIRLTNDTGYFWFFDPANIEVVVKALTGCSVNDDYWVFAGGLTNTGVALNVTDTVTGAVKVYTSVVGTPFQPIQDSSAFPCP